jgi:hypothetical protein
MACRQTARARGSMNLARCPDPKAYERANYIHVLQSWWGEAEPWARTV